MQRRADWRERLAAFFTARRGDAFDWGARDCCLSVADAVLSMTGRDFAAPLRGYRSKRGALKALLRAGHRSVADYLDTILPRTTRPRCGDVVALNDPPLNTLMLADRNGTAWGQDEYGLMHVAIPPGAQFWAV